MATLRKAKGDFNLDKLSRGFKQEKKELPRKIGNIAEQHFRSGFRKGGGQTNESTGGWKKRKRPAPGRAILVKSGKLRRDVRLRRYSWNMIRVATSSMTSDYASIHNTGGVIDHPGGTEYGFKSVQDARRGRIQFLRTGRGYIVLGKTPAHNIPIPQREFIGRSHKLNRKIGLRIRRETNLMFKRGR